MKLAMIGLGKMGGNMVRRLRRADIEVVGYDTSADVRKELQEETGMIPAPSITLALKKLPDPKIVWVMVPSGRPTDKVIKELEKRLSPGDLVIDGGNSNYHDTQRRGAILAQSGIGFVDAGTSGGIWGLENGYCMMLGGEKRFVEMIEPAIKVLAPAPDRGWAHVGPLGSGHFTKMIHNGIEYGMMQAIAEGFALLHNKEDFSLDIAQIAELWRHGSVISSWLMDLTAGALQNDQKLDSVAPYVADSGEGRWTMLEAIDQGVAAPVISLALQMRFTSQDQVGFTNRVLAVMRNAFGGHDIKTEKGEGKP